MTNILDRFENVRASGDSWTAKCPAHEDRQNSLSISRGDGKWLLHCHAGCDWESVGGAAGVPSCDLFDDDEGRSYPWKHRTTGQPLGLSLEEYAKAKALPVDFLRNCGLRDAPYDNRPAIRIPYLAEGGAEIAVRYRIALDGDRFRWKKASKPCLYGLNRIGSARNAGHVVLVEGESDCHTLWHYGIPSVGLPGATNWREDRDAKFFDGIETIYVVIEPDKGGESVRQWLGRSAIRERAKLLQLPAKDPSAMHIGDAAGFASAWQAAIDAAVPWMAEEVRERCEQQAEAWELCAELAGADDILAEFDNALAEIGLVGERRVAKLLYLALNSRLQDRPVSVAVKGPSSGGKSFTVESVLRFFPSEAFYALTAMSDRALAYSSEPLKHRHLVIYEAAGMSSDFASYLIRSLLSEGRLRYETVEKTDAGMIARMIEREGPTGLIVTTTSLKLHPENETRLLSLTVTDTPEQTAAVFRSLATGETSNFDLSRWQALQTWLATNDSKVFIPYATTLAKMIPPVAIRLRRDFRMILELIRAHALLHQARRQKDSAGAIVAENADYAAVYALVADLVAEGADATIKPEIRETVKAVKDLLSSGMGAVTQADVKKLLKLDKSAVSRRIAAAVDLGVLRDLEDRKGHPSRLVLGDPLPDEIELLPKPEQLQGCAVVQGDEASSANSRSSGCCAYCGEPERPTDPLLTVSIDGSSSSAHRSCSEAERDRYKMAA